MRRTITYRVKVLILTLVLIANGIDIFASTSLPKPNREQIAKDLVGRSLAEGVQDGYYPSDWRWTIKEKEITALKIESVLSDNPQEYMLVVMIRLTTEEGKSFNAKVKIRYKLDRNNRWIIDYAQSLGMYVVKTGRYSDCIHAYMDSSHFMFENNCDKALEVGGRTFSHGKWKKFSTIVGPNKSSCVVPVDDGRIDYVEIP